MRNLGGVGLILLYNQSSETNRTNASADNATDCGRVGAAVHIVLILVYSLVFLVGLVLNGFTLRVYFCRAQPQASSSVTTYLKNLAASDFLISLCLPMRIANLSSNSVSVYQVYCNFGASAFYLNMYASILFMGYIAANRYLKIVHPLGTHILQRPRAAHIISSLTWIFLLVMTTTYVTQSLLHQEPPLVVPVTGSCEHLQSDKLRLVYRIAHSCSAAIFLLVLVSLVFFYYSTSRRLSTAQQRQPASSGSKNLAKSRRNMLVLVSVFCVCFVPYHLVRLPYAFLANRCSLHHVFYYLKELTVLVSVLNVCLDPLIYFIFCKAFRAQLSLRRALSTTNATVNAANLERRSSDGRMSTIKFNRKTSLTTTTKQSAVL